MIQNNFPQRVVITGAAAETAIGSNSKEITRNLQQGNSGVSYIDEFEKAGFKCHVGARTPVPDKDFLYKSAQDFLSLNKEDFRLFKKLFNKNASEDSFLALSASIKALVQAKIDPNRDNIALLVGSYIPNSDAIVAAEEKIKNGGFLGAGTAAKSMASNISANLTTAFGIKDSLGVVSSACATGTHAIGQGAQDVTHGRVERVLVGAAEGFSLNTVVGFDIINATSSKYNNTPQKASRTYDQNRDGFVPGSGAAFFVLESLKSAKKRNAPILGEIVGYGITSDGRMDMTNPHPDGDGLAKSIKEALCHVNLEDVTYINPHGTGTINGDRAELNAFKKVFGDYSNIPLISSTKTMTGHGIGAAGAIEAFCCLSAINNDYIPPNINISDMDPAFEKFPIAQSLIKNVKHNVVLNISIGFGGMSTAIAIKKYIP